MIKVLSFDGGGMMGIMPAQFLNTHPEILADVKLYAGTSTGGLLALALALGKEPRELVNFYLRRGPKIFRKTRNLLWPILRERYSATPLEKAIREVFGDTRLSDIKRARIVITATDYNRLRAENALFVFDNEAPYSCFDAARATSAAPTYFKPYVCGDRAFMDGGLICNSPADCALAEAVGRFGSKEKIHLISFGTGVLPLETPNPVPRAPWKFIDDVIDISIGGGAGRVDRLLREIATAQPEFLQYDRIDFPLMRRIEMDDKRDETLAYMLACATDTGATLNGVPMLRKAII